MKRVWQFGRHALRPLRMLLVLIVAVSSAASAVGAPRGPRLARALHWPEQKLVQVVSEIRARRLDAALEQLDALLKTNPNFRLAQLIRGDLLMARARPLGTVGGAAAAPRDRVDELVDEARARLARARLQPPDGLVPGYIVQLSARQRHALVVDTAVSTLYVFENARGAPRYVADYYITVGKNGIRKLREGDKRTPLGVYHVTGELTRDKLGDFYGSGAFPLNYPNEWDQRLGREGHGIWLHGTPRETYSRPPRASDGCVVLANADLDSLRSAIQTGVTPVIITDGIRWADARQAEAARAELSAAVEQWRKDWESRDTEAYLRSYARSFASASGGLVQWAAQKRQVNSGKSWIRVELDDMSMFIDPERSDLAVVSFRQDYRSSNLSNVMSKRQYWIREDGRWRIAHEGAA